MQEGYFDFQQVLSEQEAKSTVDQMNGFLQKLMKVTEKMKSIPWLIYLFNDPLTDNVLSLIAILIDLTLSISSSGKSF